MRRHAALWTAIRHRLIGQAKLDDPLPAGWTGDPDAGVKVSLGVGLGLLWDVLHLDWGHGLEGGSGQVAFSVIRRFHSWL